MTWCRRDPFWAGELFEGSRHAHEALECPRSDPDHRAIIVAVLADWSVFDAGELIRTVVSRELFRPFDLLK